MGESVVDDPDYYALLLVQQYLKERGYDAALHATEAQHGLFFVESKLPRGSMLMEMVYTHMEQQHHAEHTADAAGDRWDAEAALRPPADITYPDAVHASLDNLHTSAVICVAPIAPGQALTGAGDGSVSLLNIHTRGCVWKSQVGGGATLCMATRPTQDDDAAVVACGSMDGSVSLLDLHTGALLAADVMHNKYVVSACWASSSLLVTASWDETIAVLHVPSASTTLTKKFSLQMPNQATAVAMLPTLGLVVVGTKASNFLRLVDPTTGKEVGKVNLNVLGDEYVSFYCAALAVSPCGHMLLVATDQQRVLLLQVGNATDAIWKHIRNLYDLTVEPFQNPAVAFHRSGCIAYVVSAGGWVHIFDLSTAKVVAKVKAHDKHVRGLGYDAVQDVLYTCSLDRNVRILKHARVNEAQQH